MNDSSELCIVGAGITGLNALVVASGYLGRDDSVVLVDTHPRAGGMWVDTYDYVRLHQPHGNFTAGNIGWQLGAERAHLASKSEVLDHLEHCLQVAAKRVAVDERFGWEYLSHDEVDGGVEVTLRSPAGETSTLRTKRLIKAFGHRVQPNDPLPTTSSRVRSTTPEQLEVLGKELRADSAPVWILGSGKTAMDAAHQLIKAYPGREVHMLAGSGTIFSRRETFFPQGARRWWGGTPINTMLRQVGERFDGTNEDEVRAWYQSVYGISPVPGSTNFFGANLSQVELTEITAGLRSIEREYFVDAVDRDDHVDLVLRSGATRRAPVGTWLVNCTGSLLRETHPHEPVLSQAGAVLSLQMRAATTGIFSAFAGYYMTHLFLTGKLRHAGLYALDVEELTARNKSVVGFASMSLALHNLSVLSDALPNKVALECGLDYDRWYPFPRRLLGMMSFLRSHRRERDHHRATLDTLGERFGIRVGPLVQEEPAAPAR